MIVKQFNNDEINVLRDMIYEHQNGVSADYLAPRQKPLTYHELEVLRRLVAERDRANAVLEANDRAEKLWPTTPAEMGVKLANDAIKNINSGMNLVPPKTSQLLEDAASLLEGMASIINPADGKTFVLGIGWVRMVAQLRNRAGQFKAMGS
jgi:hypothetical protein